MQLLFLQLLQISPMEKQGVTPLYFNNLPSLSVPPLLVSILYYLLAQTLECCLNDLPEYLRSYSICKLKQPLSLCRTRLFGGQIQIFQGFTSCFQISNTLSQRKPIPILKYNNKYLIQAAIKRETQHSSQSKQC